MSRLDGQLRDNVKEEAFLIVWWGGRRLGSADLYITTTSSHDPKWCHSISGVKISSRYQEGVLQHDYQHGISASQVQWLLEVPQYVLGSYFKLKMKTTAE